MSDDLPNLDLFIKVVGMTGSEHDGEAIAAMRRANSLLKKWGWDWDRLLRGKVRIVEDPFNSVPAPPSSNEFGRGAGTAPQRPSQAPPPRSASSPGWQQPYPPRPQPRPTWTRPRSPASGKTKRPMSIHDI